MEEFDFKFKLRSYNQCFYVKVFDKYMYKIYEENKKCVTTFDKRDFEYKVNAGDWILTNK